MHSKISKSKIIYEGKSSIGRLLFQSSSIEYVHLTISPNASIDEHTIEFLIDFYLIEGKGEILINDQRHQLNKGDMIRVLPNLKRSWKNPTVKELVILGIKHKVNNDLF